MTFYMNYLYFGPSTYIVNVRATQNDTLSLIIGSEQLITVIVTIPSFRPVTVPSLEIDTRSGWSTLKRTFLLDAFLGFILILSFKESPTRKSPFGFSTHAC